MEPYHRIVIEAEKFSPKFASRGSNKQWPIYTYRPKNMQNGRWSVDIVLRTSYAEVIFGTQTLTPDFGTVNNLFKMASNGEVIFMKIFPYCQYEHL